jgi:Flp pilus assembly pilin Flp
MIDRANVLLLGLVSAALAGTDRLRREEGQTFVEYAIVILFIVVAGVTVTAWGGLRDAISGAIDSITGVIDNAPN